jgi:hypothetical protein
MSENQFLPLILLFLFGGFAVLSAVLKARAHVTAFSDVVLAVLEGISGMALMAAALPTSGSFGVGFADWDPHGGVGGRFVHGPHGQSLCSKPGP